MKLVIFSGTTEGRRLSRLLAEKGAEVVVSVATEYGCEEQGACLGVSVLTGHKTAAEMAEVVRGCDLCVDATHPYAEDASREIRTACCSAGVRLVRLLRRESRDLGDAIVVQNAQEAAEVLARLEGNILLTTGSRELQAYASLPPERLYPRVLATAESLRACEALRIPHRNIIAMQGPFSKELNTAMIRQFRIAVLVSKDGGSTGGFPEKLAAAKETGVQLMLLRRPEESGRTFEEVEAICEEMMTCRSC